MFDLNTLFQSLFSFKKFLTKLSKQTFAVTLLFQCNYLLIVGANNLVWQVYFFIGFFRHGAGSILKFSWASPYLQLVYTKIPWDQTSKRYSERVSYYMLIKYGRRTMNFFNVKRGSWIRIPTQNTIWYNTDYVRKNNVFSYHIVVSAGFELAIRESRFANRIYLFADRCKHFLWNLRINTFLLLEFLLWGKPQSFSLHFKLATFLGI